MVKNKPSKRGRPRASRSRRFSVEERGQIIGQLKMNASINSLAKEWGCSKSSIRAIRDKMAKTGTVKDRKRSGRPRSTTVRQDRLITRQSLTDPFLPAKAIALKLSPLFKTSRWTISRRLRDIGLKPYVPRKKPLISEVNKQKRFKWAEKHVEWKESAWQRVVFSDETPVTLFQWTGRRFCWRRKGTGFQEKHLRPTVKHGGGKIQVWGCFSWMGAGPLYRINGIMDAKKYHQILIHHMAPYIKGLSGKQGVELIFQQTMTPSTKQINHYLPQQQETNGA